MVRRMSRVGRTGLVLLACLLPFTLHGDPGEVFQQHCAACHGVQGQGATGIPNLVDNVWQYGGALEDIERSVTYGRQSIMPAFGAPLSVRGLNQVVGYVQSLGGPVDASAEDLAAGETLFMMFCGSCHGEQGTGTAALGAPDLTDDVWLYGGSKTALQQSIANGRSGQMPAFGERLDDTQIRLLVMLLSPIATAEPSELTE